MAKKNHRGLLLIAALGVIGVLCALFMTKWGVGLSPDSLVYIEGARNLSRGQGYTDLAPDGDPKSIVHFPPLFSSLMAVLGVFGIDPMEGARWLNALFFGASVTLVGVWIYRVTGGATWPSLFGSFLMLTGSNMLVSYTMAWSEPAFIFFSLSGLLLLATYIGKPSPPVLVASALTIGLAFLTRYVGVALVVAATIGLLALSKRSYPKRLFDCVLLGAVSALPMALFVVRNQAVVGGASDMKMGFHPVSIDHFKSALETASGWLAPGAVPFFVRVSLLLVAAGCLAMSTLMLRRQGGAKYGDAPGAAARARALLAIFILVYCLGLAFFITFFSFDIGLDTRTLLPVQVLSIILVSYWAYGLISSPRVSRPLRALAIVIGLGFALSYLARGAQVAVLTHRDGQGYAGRAWRESEVLRKVRALPSDARIYANVPSVVYHLTGRTARGIPNKFDPHAMSANREYQSELALLKERLGQEGGVLVYLNRIKLKHLPSENELKEGLAPRSVEVAADGSIYELAAENKARS